MIGKDNPAKRPNHPRERPIAEQGQIDRTIKGNSLGNFSYAY
jgi:hypothetical protein